MSGAKCLSFFPIIIVTPLPNTPECSVASPLLISFISTDGNLVHATLFAKHSMEYNILTSFSAATYKNSKVFGSRSMDADLLDQQKDAKSSARDTTLLAQQFYQHDPLLVLLKDKLHLHDFLILAGAVVLVGGVYLSGWFLWTSKTRIWTTNDTLGVLLVTFVLYPLLFLIYLLVPVSIAGLFNTLRINGVIGELRRHQPGIASYEQFVQKLLTWMDKGWWAAATMVILVFYACYRLLLLEPRISSPVPYWFSVMVVAIYLPLMYAAGMSVVRLLLSLIFTNWLFYLFVIKVKPLHPDGSGGLGALGRILWISVAIMLWDALLLGVALLANNLRWFTQLEMMLLSVIYIVLTPALLIGWLIFPHRVMVSARDEALQPLADEYQHVLMQSLSPAEHDIRTVVTETRRLTALKQRYDLVRTTFPTWPLEVNGLGRLLVTVVLPVLLPFILPLITSLISSLGHLLGLP
jgi:hypothetical protein